MNIFVIVLVYVMRSRTVLHAIVLEVLQVDTSHFFQSEGRFLIEKGIHLKSKAKVEQDG